MNAYESMDDAVMQAKGLIQTASIVLYALHNGPLALDPWKFSSSMAYLQYELEDAGKRLTDEWGRMHPNDFKSKTETEAKNN